MNKESQYAALESQLGSDICTAEDTEEMFILRASDDYESKKSLAGALARRYRFREAIDVYHDALTIKDGDPFVYVCLGGAYLTIREFDKSMAAYRRCMELGYPEKSVSLQLGVWHYLKHDFTAAAAQFARCLPCGDETAVAAVYFHSLCQMRCGAEMTLLPLARDLKVTHHTAYRLAVSVFSGEVRVEDARNALDKETDPLAYVTLGYGLGRYLKYAGDDAGYHSLLHEILKRRSVWPSIPYLAAWSDVQNGKE